MQLLLREVEGRHSLRLDPGPDQVCNLVPRMRAKVAEDAGCAIRAPAVARVAEHAMTRERRLAVRDGLLADSSRSDREEQGGEPQYVHGAA